MAMLRNALRWIHRTNGSAWYPIHQYFGDLLWVYPWGWDLCLFGHYLTWREGELTLAPEDLPDAEVVLFRVRR